MIHTPKPDADIQPTRARPARAVERSDGGLVQCAPARGLRVTLTAPKGYAACRLAGSPTGVVFAHLGTTLDVTAGRYGDQTAGVTFGPGRPVHFDIQVPDQGHGTPADETSFTLRAPDGEIPGTSVAEGRFEVAPGTVIGPVRPGA